MNVDSSALDYKTFVSTNNVLLFNTKNGVFVSYNNAITWEKTNLPGENFVNFTYSNGKYYLLTNTKILTSLNGLLWVDITFDYKVGFSWEGSIFENNGTLYLKDRNYINFFKLDTIKSEWTEYPAPPLWYFYKTSIIPIGQNVLLAWSLENRILTSINGGDIFVQFNDSMQHKRIYDIFIQDDTLYLLNLHGLWKRSVKDFYPITSLDIDVVEKVISIEPNPTLDMVKIKISGTNNTFTLTILDQNTNIVLKKYALENLTQEIDLCFLRPGVYYFYFQSDSKSYVKKL
ncbi:MAG: T9SS type A sorting domain-containing protein [Saprospiraceae bacterium]|nr:T9SS type A sorting domain-containing protein [Saprospiraceae bacterium]